MEELYDVMSIFLIICFVFGCLFSSVIFLRFFAQRCSVGGPPAAAAAVAARAKTLTVEKKLQTDLCSLLACVVEHLFKSIHMVNDAIVVFYFIQLQNPNLGRPTSSKCYKFCLLSGSNLI